MTSFNAEVAAFWALAGAVTAHLWPQTSKQPVAVAGVVCSPRQFEAFAGEQLRANKFGHTGASWYRDELQHALSRMLEKNGVDPQRLLAAPEREDNCVAYCPLCRAQYTVVREGCADCGYQELLKFAQEPESKPAVQ